MKDSADDPRLDRITEMLIMLVELSGLSRRELARRLGSDYPMRRVLQRDKEIRLGLLLQVADALDVKPLEIFRLALGDGDAAPSPLLRRLQERSLQLRTVLGRLETPTPGTTDSEPGPPAGENGPG